MTSVCEQGQLNSIEQAITALSELLTRPAVPVATSLEQATGKILAADIRTNLDSPRYDNSAMDGYAFNSADLTTDTHSLPLAGCMAAGDPEQTLPAGHCMQIFTGATIPRGADTVVAQENCLITDDTVSFASFTVGQNIRRQGEELQAGEPLLAKGSRLRAQEIGLLASQGHAVIPTCAPLRIGIISCGNELQTPDNPLQDGQIYDTNRYLLASLLQGWGFTITQYPHLRDNLADTCELLGRAASEQDIVISTGGVSVGDADHLKVAIAQLGQLNLWRVAIQPGKPLAFGSIGNTPWIGLPGNPGASLVTALIIVRPALLAAQGQVHTAVATLPVQADFTRSKARVRQQYLQARLQIARGQLLAGLHPKQSSAMLANCSWADGMVVIAPQQQVQPGDMLEFIPYSELL